MVDIPEQPPRTVVLAGPTAVGKTALSIALAQALDAEIISADSAQIYRGLDIGTAKPDPILRRDVPHHLLDIVPPEATYSVAQFHDACWQAMQDVWSRGKRVLLVGGTGLWIRAVIRGFRFIDEPRRDEWRRLIHARAATWGWEAVRRQVRMVDPESWEHIAPADHRRLSRVLEVFWGAGRTLPRQSEGPVLPVSYWVLTRPTAELRHRIQLRTERMLADGLREEVLGLLRQGIPPGAQSLTAIGYREVVAWASGRVADEELEGLIVRHTQHYAKRQLTWFRAETEARWADLSAWPESALLQAIVRGASTTTPLHRAKT